MRKKKLLNKISDESKFVLQIFEQQDMINYL